MRAGGTPRALIAMALQIPTNVAGDMLIGQKSADSQHFVITAKVPSPDEGPLTNGWNVGYVIAGR